MAQVRRPQRPSNATKYLELAASALFGAILMFWCLGPSDETAAATTSLRPASTPDGWNPIHVYYGSTKGLKIPPSQEWFAQVHQDEIVLDLIGENGYFVDLAANHATEWTNTLALERHGWKGLCVEPNPAYWYGLSHRSCQVVGAMVGGDAAIANPDDQTPVQVKLRGVFGGIVGKLDEKLANRKKEPDSPTEERYLVPLRSVLERFQAPRVIDYLSLDVEGAEYLIMQDFPFDAYTIRVMTVERPSAKLKELLEQHGYHELKLLAWWGETLWAHESTGITVNHPKITKIETEGK